MVADGGVRRARQPALPDDGRDVGLGDPRAVARQAAARLRRRLVRRAAGRRRAQGPGRRARGARRSRRRSSSRAEHADELGAAARALRRARARAATRRRRVRARRSRWPPAATPSTTRCSGASPRRRPRSGIDRRAAQLARARSTSSVGHGRRERASRSALARAVPAWAWLAGDRRRARRSSGSRSRGGWSRPGSWSTRSSTPSSRSRSRRTGSFLVRGVPSGGYGFVYPVLIAPAWRLFGVDPDALRAPRRRSTRCVMSLAASRRTSSPGGSSRAAARARRRAARRARPVDALHRAR